MGKPHDNRGDSSGFAPSGFFVLRTPLLPVDRLLGWRVDLQAPRAVGDPKRLEAALTLDRLRLRKRLKDVLDCSEFREGLFLSAPGLEKRLVDWFRDPDSKPGQKVERPLVEYFVRAAVRPTPFGLFAGCSVGTLGSETRLTLAPRAAHQRHTRFDMDYLFRLAGELERNPGLRMSTMCHPNSSLYESAGRLRYAEARIKDMVRSYHLVAVDPDGYLLDTLERAREGALPGELAQALVAADPEITLAEAEEYIDELLDAQVLVSELAPAVTGSEPIHRLLETLKAIPAAEETAAQLERAHASLRDLDEDGLGAAPQRYRDIAESMSDLLPDVNLSRLFQVDMTKPAAKATLSDTVVSELLRSVQILHRLSLPAERQDLLSGFRAAFMERYGEREVPLVEALDEETGIGFERSRAPTAEGSPLLAGLPFPSTMDGAARWTGRDAYMLRKLEETGANGVNEILLNAEDLASLEHTKLPPLPDAFAVMATLISPSPTSLAQGDFQVLLRHVAGPSGGTLLGRFCHGDEALCRFVREHVRAEEALEPDAVFAEIVHLPEGRVGNILCRPVLRDYEIPFLGRSGAPPERQLPVGDLLVSVKGGRVVLRSARLDREVIPRLTTAHNFSLRSLGIYRFLCTLQYQGVATVPGWDWGPLESVRFLPRVRTGRLILARARWVADRREIEPLLKASGAARFQAVQDWRARRKLPRLVGMAEADNELEIDFDNVLSVEAFLHSARTSIERWGPVRLVEPLAVPDQLCVSGPEGRFAHELIVPFVSTRKPSQRPSPRGIAVPSRAQRTLCPGSEWLYANLYTGTSTADRLLREIGPFIRNTLQTGASDRWFFIRYGDPEWHLRLRLHGDPHTLRTNVLPSLCGFVSPLLGRGCVWRFQIDTYEREIERYGGVEGMLLAERLFHADSEAALAIVELLAGDEGADARWRLTLRGMDMLLADLGFDLDVKLAVVTRAYQAFASEFGLDSPDFRKQLGKRFAAEREALEVLLDPTRDTESPLWPGLSVLRRRSADLVPVMDELQASERAQRLSRPLTELALSYVHMHANRVLRSAQRAQELVLYDFLVRLYEAQRHRARARVAAAPSRASGRALPQRGNVASADAGPGRHAEVEATP